MLLTNLLVLIVTTHADGPLIVIPDAGPDQYVYSGQVSLRHKRFYDICGYHPEGVSPGEEELTFCKHFNGVEDAPKILWPATYGTTLNAPFIPFVNIGMDISLNATQPGEM